MLLWIRWSCCLVALASGVLLGGCSVSSDNQQDDEKEPHYVLGKSRVDALDYAAAADAFEESLEVDPHSAAAHYQLAMLYESKLTNAPSAMAVAIYHYQAFLNLNPKAQNRDLINQHIYVCKQQLVNDVMQLPTAPAVQLQIEKLSAQNRALQDEVNKWHSYYAAELAARNNPYQNPVAPPGPAGGNGGLPVAPGQPHPMIPPPGGATPPPTAPIHLHTHTVTPGETLAAIARKAHTSLATLETLNPGLNPKRLRVGEVINLP